jgi:alanine-glyoxylate transaminase/serine-glyoxylate transaminase/serine-pyruvate transaminase
MPFEMDAWGVDVAVAGSQKGLMTPPGLSFVGAGSRAVAAHQTADLRTRYWDWTVREGEEHYHKYCGTPPEHMLFAFDKALELLFDEGLDAVFERHRLLAGAVQRAAAVWSEGGAMELNIVEPAQRSNSVTTVLLNGERAPKSIVEYCDRKCGVVVGMGIGALTGKALRIAHMGHVNAPMTLGTLSAMEIAFQALDVPHGKGGVQAAIDWLAAEVPA